MGRDLGCTPGGPHNRAVRRPQILSERASDCRGTEGNRSRQVRPDAGRPRRQAAGTDGREGADRKSGAEPSDALGSCLPAMWRSHARLRSMPGAILSLQSKPVAAVIGSSAHTARLGPAAGHDAPTGRSQAPAQREQTATRSERFDASTGLLAGLDIDGLTSSENATS